MSDELLRKVKNLLASGKGDTKRLLEIINTIKEGSPVVMSDYRYIESFSSQGGELQLQEGKEGNTKPQTRNLRDESIEILRIRLAEGQITVNEFKELKKVLTGE